LRVKANIIKKIYKTGKKYAANYKEEMQIKFDEKSNTSGTAGGLKYVNRSKGLKNCGPPERWRQFT
jgi:hypothetical protein